MSSCGQGDNVPEQVSTQLHVADRGEAGGQGCPSGQSRSANSNPWDGEILSFPTKALEIEVFSHSRCSPVHPGRDGGLWAVSDRAFQHTSRIPPAQHSWGQIWNVLSYLGTLMQERGWKSRGGSQAAELSWMKCGHQKKKSFPQVKSAMGGVIQSSGKWGAKPPWGDPAPVGNLH